jgi:hypothetical protein|tara:strand:+ start:2100 stop:2288 length:189 start_codon:yes stop_codon:yes gene_type:complete
MSVPRTTPIPKGTIRMTVQIEVPHEEPIMNYGAVAREKIKEYIDNNTYSFTLENGASNTDET